VSRKKTMTDLQSEEKKVCNLQETNSKLESQVDGLEITLEAEKKTRMELELAKTKLERDAKTLTESQKQTLTDLQSEEAKVANLQKTRAKLENKVDCLEMTLEGEKKRTEQGEEDLKNERESRALLEKEHIDLSRKLELSESREKAAGNTKAQTKINQNFYCFQNMMKI